MDELEISGKRYISARRAAKEYKYHSDYIGQLIRGKKLLGRKVGRSWYVELDSMKAFFGGEGAAIPEAPLVAKAVAEKPAAKPEPVEEVVPEEAPAVLQVPEERIQVNKAFKVEEPAEEKVETPRDSFHIPVHIQRKTPESSQIKTSALTYVEDDEPHFTAGKRYTESTLASAMVMPRTEAQAEEAEEIAEEHVTEDTRIYRKTTHAVPAVLRIAAAGVFVLAIVVGGSLLVSTHMVIEAGKTASVGFSIK
jgi:hypothetical protein